MQRITVFFMLPFLQTSVGFISKLTERTASIKTSVGFISKRTIIKRYMSSLDLGSAGLDLRSARFHEFGPHHREAWTGFWTGSSKERALEAEHRLLSSHVKVSYHVRLSCHHAKFLRYTLSKGQLAVTATIHKFQRARSPAQHNRVLAAEQHNSWAASCRRRPWYGGGCGNLL